MNASVGAFGVWDGWHWFAIPSMGAVFWFGQKKGDVLFYSHEKNAVCYGGTVRFVGACSDERSRGLP